MTREEIEALLAASTVAEMVVKQLVEQDGNLVDDALIQAQVEASLRGQRQREEFFDDVLIGLTVCRGSQGSTDA